MESDRVCHANRLTMRWSERRTAVRSTLDDFHTSTPRDARSRPPWLILFSLGDCDGHLCVHRPALARQTLIETKTGAAVQIFSD